MRNIVICCDGTSNEFCEDNTNVVKLYQMLVKDPAAQLCFYDPGVGTFASPAALLPITKRITRTLGLAIGFGLTSNVEDAYLYLMNQWQPGDRIFLFGFSRGAYAARAIAAMIHRCGLLDPGQGQLVEYASRVFRNVADENWKISREFGTTFGRPCPIHFLGLWDTVSSVGWAWDPKTLPYTANNPSVAIVRHAVAIDERRGFFRQNLWGDGPDVKQVWFAGVHCDVGGSYPPLRSGLSQLTLQWMVGQAEAAGLLVDPVRRDAILSSPAPSHRGEPNESLTDAWKLAEYYPKRRQRKVVVDGKEIWQTFYWPNLFGSRVIPEDSLIHSSVLRRRHEVPAYKPRNLPQRYRVVE
jgi:uncharacterized protein (DUF2235 family)